MNSHGNKEDRASGKHIKWDEEVISEHDRERGTRQKIDEPPTPYSYANVDADDECDEHDTRAPNKALQEDVSHNWEALNAKLNFESQQQKIEEDERLERSRIGEPHADDDVPGAGKKRPAKDSFAEKRAAHYNEYLVLKAMKNKPLEDDDEDA